MNRREFISIPAGSIGGWLLYSLAREPLLLGAETNNTIALPLHFFTTHEAEVIQAACARIIPTDESGPGATEAGVFIYIDRQLAGPYGEDKNRYTKGPWIQSVPEHGYQGKETPREVYRAGIEQLGDFSKLTPQQQDKALESIEKTRFFELLRTHTLEGMFCDPMHGGNANLVGWQLIGFPGPVMSYREQIDQYAGKAYRPKPRSLAQILGHPVHPTGGEPTS